LALIRAHPDLAGKAQVAGDLTVDSETEQTSAGLDRCTPDEVENFQTLNGQYKEKFGFPFVMAIRDSNRHEILAAFKSRLGNELQTEFETAISEIHKIAALRLQELKA
jgi:OHCU decarboxylase